MGSKGLKSVIMCVLILGIIFEVEGKSCCKSTLGRNCYNACRLRFSQRVCATTCRCKIIKGTKCPPGFPKLDLLPNSGKEETHYFHLPCLLFLMKKNLFTYQLIYCLAGEPVAIEYCNLGCVSSMCDTMNSGKFIQDNFNYFLEN